MISSAENQLLTQTDRGTPAGDLLRRYWQPVALAQELPLGGAPLAIKILGEDLALFRDDQGRIGLLGIHCSHRGTDLSYGRIEDGGLRCLYHGWLYDIYGRCLEQPGEPGCGVNRDAIRHLAYPCSEHGGIIFTYMGPGEPPLLPNYEFLNQPPGHCCAYKVYHECNFLQANEGNIDPVHLSFLHRFLEHKEERYTGVRGSEESHYNLIAKAQPPTLDVEITDFGVRIYSVRRMGEGKSYLRVSNFVLPNLSTFPGQTGGQGYGINWHVPIDDTHHWKYCFFFNREAPLDQSVIDKSLAEVDDQYRPVRNENNRFMQDRGSMRTQTFTGMGSGFQTHDAFATGSQGVIQDRTQENIVSSDIAIIAARKLMEKAIRDIQAGGEPPHVIRQPEQNKLTHLLVISDLVEGVSDWKRYTKKLEAEASGRQQAIITNKY
jgi:phenylpropionate dioxygenase-like ring-hydroxylating dioxygenase large terminal subunit